MIPQKIFGSRQTVTPIFNLMCSNPLRFLNSLKISVPIKKTNCNTAISRFLFFKCYHALIVICELYLVVCLASPTQDNLQFYHIYAASTTIWNDRYLNRGYNKALTDPISWRLAFADCRFFQILSDYSTEIFALLACQLGGLIWKEFFCQYHVILWDRNYFRAIFTALSTFLFTLFTFHVVSRTTSKGF